MLPRACRAALQLRPRAWPDSPLRTPTSFRLLHATPSSAKLLPAQQLRDEAIRTKFIRVVGDAAGGLGPVTSRNNVLNAMDRSKKWLMLVDEQELGPEAAADLRTSPNTKVGICKIIDKKELFQKSKERSTASKQKKQANKKEEKEFQFTWGVAVNDLQHKVKRAQQTLDKGGRTSLVITSPKGSKPLSPADKKMFTDMLKDTLGFTEGKAKIWKPEEWTGGKTSIYLEGVKQSQPEDKASTP